MHEHIQIDPGSFHITPPVCKAFAGWQPILDEPLKQQALDVLQGVVERLSDPAVIGFAIQQAARQTTGLWQWVPSSLISGYGSLALLFHFMARTFPGYNWERVARQYLRLAAEFTHQQPLVAPALFGGSSGMASVVSFFARDDERYRHSMATLSEHVAEQVLYMTWQREQASEGIADGDYDIISGAAGILGFLVTLEQPTGQIHAAIRRLIEYLVWLAESDTEQERRRWFLSPRFYPIELHRERYPDGYFNCGLAHGIAGPLAALAIAWRAGYQIPEQREAIHSLASWLVDHQIQDAWGINWPAGVPLRQSYSSDSWSTLPPTRTAWCYGAPGIARALWLAGGVLQDSVFCQTAIEAIESVLQRPLVARGIDSVTFCHGVAGLLDISLRFAHETERILIRQHIPLLVQQILNGFDADSPLGFRDLEQEHHWVDDPGLLTGAVGVALTLLAASTPIEPGWDRIFLIA